jgi:uncharacterized protein (DUF362 family)
MQRRSFLKRAAGLAIAAPVASLARPESGARARVALVKTSDRAAGVARAVDLFGPARLEGKSVFLKPNCNSADAPPGSTHLETLAALARKLRALGAGPITVGDRSGMGVTRQVMEEKGVLSLCRELDLRPLVLDELQAQEWQRFSGAHWEQGFWLPRPALAAGAIVQTCCLKTHRFGGHFTLSLKNSVGLAAKRVPGDSYDYMHELHGSPHQRRMIAEINAGYAPALVVLDGVEAFLTGGPEAGQKAAAEVVLAGSDRVAIDAVGVAILRLFGTTPEVSRGAVFEQEQIARAAELGLGVRGPEQIELVTADPASEVYAARVRAELRRPGRG